MNTELNWLIEMQYHVIKSTALREDSWICLNLESDVVGRGQNFYDAIQNAMNAKGISSE